MVRDSFSSCCNVNNRRQIVFLLEEKHENNDSQQIQDPVMLKAISESVWKLELDSGQNKNWKKKDMKGNI